MRYSHVLLLLCSAIGVSCCAALETGAVIADPKVAAYRKELHYSIDQIIELAAVHDTLQGKVLMIEKDLTDSKTGDEYLRSLLETLLRIEDDLRRSVSELEGDLR